MRFLIPSLLIIFSPLFSSATAQTSDEILAKLRSSKPELNMSATALSIAELNYDETLRVAASYLGCFHRDYQAYQFTQTSVKHSEIGSTYISSEQVELLDRYFSYLAKLKDAGNCTSKNVYTLKVMRGEAVVREQTVIDATCGFGDLTHGLPYLTPESLIAEITERQTE